MTLIAHDHSASNTPALEVRELYCSIAGVPILNGVSFSVAPGSTVGVIGPNGSGKTTLFNCISGFLNTQSGTISIGGKNVVDLLAHQRARLGLGRVFQSFGVFREMTVLENIIVALESLSTRIHTLFPWGAATRRIRETAMGHLESVGLASKARDKAGSLSGGQMRLLEIVRTVAFNAQVCLLDEPTAGVSPKMKDAIVSLIKRVHEQGRSVLVIEHDINFIQRFADRIVLLDGGKVALDGPPEQVRSSSIIREVYFGGDSAS